MGGARYTREQRISAAARIISEYERQTGVPMNESAIGRILANSAQDPFPALIEHAQACARRLEFCAEVDATVAGTKPHWMHVTAARTTPSALREVGLPNLPIFHTQKHVRHELAPKNPANGHMHGLSPELLKKVPELLESPVAVWDDLPGRDEVHAMLDALDSDGLPLVAVLLPDGRSETTGERCNFLLTVYGNSKGFEKLERACDEGRVLRMDAQKMRKLLSSSAPQLRGSPRSLDGIIRQTEKAVNSPNGEARRNRNDRPVAEHSRKPGARRPISGRAPAAPRAPSARPSDDRRRDFSPGRGSGAWTRKARR